MGGVRRAKLNIHCVDTYEEHFRNASTSLLFSNFCASNGIRNKESDLILLISCRYCVGSGVLNSFGNYTFT